MHPLNKNVFGNETGTIKVHYNDGTGVHTGWIVKQPSATKWRVANSSTAANAVNDTNSFKCELVGNAAPSAHQFTIKAFPVANGVTSNSALYVSSIDGHHVVANNGVKYIWTLQASPPNTHGKGTPYAVLETN